MKQLYLDLVLADIFVNYGILPTWQTESEEVVMFRLAAATRVPVFESIAV